MCRKCKKEVKKVISCIKIARNLPDLSDGLKDEI